MAPNRIFYSMKEINELESLPIEIPAWEGNHPFLEGRRIQKYTPESLKYRGSIRSRTKWFLDVLREIRNQIDRPVPYAFRTNDGSLRSLDAGCLGILYHTQPPQVRFECYNGFIIAVEPNEAADTINNEMEFPEGRRSSTSGVSEIGH